MRFLLLLLSFVTASQAFAERQLVDRVVAIVNAEIILHSDIEDKIRNDLPVIVASYPAKRSDPIYEQALQDAINFLLVQQEADKLGIEFDDAAVEASINKVFKARGLDMGVLMEELRKQNLSYDQYKDNYRKTMILNRFKGAVIMPQVKITEKDLETYYMKRTGQKSNNVRVTLSQIVVNVPGEMDSEIAEGKKKLANKIYRDLQGGLDFEEAVKIYSDDPSARDNGGQMGAVALRDLALPIRKSIEGLSPGEFSRPVLAGSSYYIFKLNEREFTGSREFKDAKSKLENELQMVQLEDQTLKWLEERRQRSEVKLIR